MYSQNTSWDILTETQIAWDSLLKDCESAETSIYFEQFIFNSFKEGQIGKKFVDIFFKKAQEGVVVRLLLDAMGSYKAYTSYALSQLKKAGVEVKFHTTLAKLPKKRAFSFFLRDHRKLAIIDEKIGHIGGVVVTEAAKKWRDTNVRLIGPVVPRLQKAFDHIWGKGKRVRVKDFSESSLAIDGFSVVPNAPRVRHKYIHKQLLKEIRRAKYSIHLTTPYFGPPPRMMRALLRAARRGVDVRLLVPYASDWHVADLVAQSTFGRLLRAGIRVFRLGRFIHAKTAVIDGMWTTVGSCNLDYMSLWLNYELNIVSIDQNFANSFEDQFRWDCTEAVELDLENWERRSIFQRFLEKCAFPLRPFI